MNRFDENVPSDWTILALRRLLTAMLDRPWVILNRSDMDPLTGEQERQLEQALYDVAEDVVGTALDDAEQRRAAAVAHLTGSDR